MPGPGGGGSQINSLIDLMQPAGVPAAQEAARTFGTWDQDRGYYMQPAVPGFYTGFQAGGGGPSGMGGGGGVFGIPQESARYFDPSGNPRIDDPRQVAAESGITLSDLAGGLLPRSSGKSVQGGPGQGYEYPSDQGGFFRIEDVFGLTGTPTLAPIPGPAGQGAGPGRNLQPTRQGQIPVPAIATFGMGAPSTNNWRLLGRGPGYIMRNGMLINTRDPYLQEGGPMGWVASGGATGEQAAQGLGRVALGTGAHSGMPNYLATGIAPSQAGWPGGAPWYSFHGWTT